MDKVTFKEMFAECPGVFDVPGALVEAARVDTDARKMELLLRVEGYADEAEFDVVSREICKAYALESVDIKLIFVAAVLTEETVLAALKCVTAEYPAVRGILEGCEVEIDESAGMVTLALQNGGAELMSAHVTEHERALYKLCGRAVRVSLKSIGGNADEVIAARERARRELIARAAEKLPEIKDSGERKKSWKSTLMGRKPGDDITKMSEIGIETGRVTIEGEVFSTNHRDIVKTGAKIICFDMTDYTGSIRINKYMDKEKAEPIAAEIEPGMWLRLSGRVNFNRFENDIVFEPENIFVCDQPETRVDNAEKKRVELHFHTKMSAMDAVVDAKAAIERAASWGHKAVAITDHGVVQAFPEAMNAVTKINKKRAADDKFKVIYGIECYYFNDVERVCSVFGSKNTPLDDEFIAFDIETTGLSSETDKIIEIGAVLFKNGEIVDKWGTFIDAKVRVPQKITELTGITDAMLVGAPEIEEAIDGFLGFVGDRVLAAHNAGFDIGFIAAACKRLGRSFDPTYIDTRNMSRGLLHTLNRFDLHTVATELQIPEFNHHRAYDDAGAVAYILFDFFKMLLDGGVSATSEINEYLAANVQENVLTVGGSNHMILLAKNEQGIRNLYELVSKSHLKYFRKHPLIPRSALDRHRDGLIVGSACESGELFKAVLNWKSSAELEKIASYYDFLEIQPTGNNEFLIRSGKAKDIEELREYNRIILRLGDKLGKPVVATCDVHFMEPRDEVYRRILMSDFDDGDNQAPLFFRTTEEMLAEFEYLGDRAHDVVVDNPNKIADMCEFVKPVRDGTFAPVIKNSAEDLRTLVYSKLERLYGENPVPEIMSRVEEEMNSITKHHFDVIYMISQKLVSRSLADGYLVGSRGSVGSSVVAYFSDITEVNALPPHYRCPHCQNHELSDAAACGPDLPDKNCPVCGIAYEKDGFDLPFATFLGFDGDKKPDIDLNFSGEYQPRAHQYTQELFGEGHVFRSGTIGTLADKNAYGYVKKYNEARGISVSNAEMNRLASGLVGVKKSTGQHPGGLIVVPEGHDINEFTPVQHPADKSERGIITTHFDYHSIEENLLKLDELGHDDPTIIKMLQDLTGVDPQKIPLDDKDTLSLFTSTKVLGFENDPVVGERATFAVPEFGTKFVREMLGDTKPTTFDELLSISGLSHGTDVWLGNAKDIITAGHATLKEIIACRDDIMLDLIARGMDRKTAFSIMESVRKGKGINADWEDSMQEAGVPDWYIDSCKKIKYLFPKAHATAYVMMALRIAWFKVFYPLEFYCAYFSIRAKAFEAAAMTRGIETVKAKMRELSAQKTQTTKDEEMLTTLEVTYEFYRRGFEFKNIDLYKSDASLFLISDGKILPPFGAIPGIGDVAAQAIVEERKNGEFISLEELTLRCPKASKSIVELLITNNAVNDIPETSQVTLF